MQQVTLQQDSPKIALLIYGACAVVQVLHYSAAQNTSNMHNRVRDFIFLTSSLSRFETLSLFSRNLFSHHHLLPPLQLTPPYTYKLNLILQSSPTLSPIPPLLKLELGKGGSKEPTPSSFLFLLRVALLTHFLLLFLGVLDSIIVWVVNGFLGTLNLWVMRILWSQVDVC